MNGPAGQLAMRGWMLAASTHHEELPSAPVSLNYPCMVRTREAGTLQEWVYLVSSCRVNGFPWAQRVIDAIKELPGEKQQTCGMAFDGEGIPHPISEVQKKAQLLFENHVDDARNITTSHGDGWRLRWAGFLHSLTWNSMH